VTTCPAGHETQSTDYCDVCGIAMPPATDQGGGGTPQPGDTVPVPILDLDTPAATSDAAQPTDPAAGQTCPNCGVANLADALFCEACGYDFTTGTMPRTETPAPDKDASPKADSKEPRKSSAPPLDDSWVAELWIDPQWYAEQESPDPLPSAGPPAVVPLRNTSLLVGRESHSRDIHPDIDCGADNGVSRRHAQLTTDGSRWWVEDLGSSNGTFVAGAVDPLPKTAIDVGVKREVGPEDRIYVGSWTRLVIRKADPGEVA
jgi:hypothetical protein